MLLSRTFINNLLIVCLLGGLFWFFSDLVTYFVIAFIITAVLKVPTDYLSQLYFLGVKVPRFIAVSISFGLLALIISMFALLFVPLFTAQLKILAFNDFSYFIDKIDKPVGEIERLLIENHFIKREEGFLVESINIRMTMFLDSVQLDKIFPTVLSTATHIFVGTIMVVIITLFLLLEKGLFRKNLIALIPNKYFEVTINGMYKIEKLLSNYLLALLLQMLSTFTITSLGLILVGVEYSITIGLFTALINVVPFIGPITSTSLGWFVAISTTELDITNSDIFLLLSFKVLLAFGITHLIDAFGLQPLIYSRSVKAHPLEILVMVFAGSTIAGALGMVLAIPVYTILKVAFIELRKGYKTYRVFYDEKKVHL
jgi:predicted PurR-regulated permease PerM